MTTTPKTLPYDVARCNGIRVSDLCKKCLRKISPSRPDGPQAFIEPQVFDLEFGREQCRNFIGQYK